MDQKLENVDIKIFLGEEETTESSQIEGEEPDEHLSDTEIVEYGHIKSYVLRQARLTVAQGRAYAEFGARYILPWREVQLNYATVFGNNNPVILEIGFGMGHATAEIALNNPDFNYLAVEVHKPGVGALIERIVKQDINNIRILHLDVVPVLQKMIPPASLAGVHIFFPDPWPKKKHHKRRLIQTAFLQDLAQACLPGAYIYLATDWEEYGLWMVEVLAKASSWQNQYPDFSPRIPWRPQTAFERKGLDKEHVIREIYALRCQPEVQNATSEE